MTYVANPRATGVGVSSRQELGSALSPVTSSPLNPAPPDGTALPFQASGRLIWKLTGGAFGSTGRIAPSTLQNSRVTPGVFGSAGTVCICAALIVAPPL